MSVIACRIQNGKIHLAGDSIGLWGSTQEKTNSIKLFKVSNDFAFGSVGMTRESALLRMFTKTHTPLKSTEDAMLDFMSEFQDWVKTKTGDYGLNNLYIIAFKGRAWQTEDVVAAEIKDFAAVGAGRDFALAALYCGRSARKAVEAACHLSAYCEAPITGYTFRCA